MALFPNSRELGRSLIGGLLLVLLAAFPAHGGEIEDIDRAEQLGWTDPEAALELIQKIQPSVQNDEELVELLTVRGILRIDKRQDQEAQEISGQLEAMGKRGLVAAERASHVVRAHLMCQSDNIDGARAELKMLETTATDSMRERFRIEVLRGAVLEFIGEQESAARSYEGALDLAREMKSVPHELRALQRLVNFNVRANNLDRASQQLEASRKLALGSGNEVALTSLSMQAANIASARGDVPSAVRFSEEALEHARKTTSKQLLAVALGYVADGGLRTGDYRASLRHSEEALELARHLRRNGLEQTTRFNMGMAKIGLGDIVAGKKLCESAIDETQEGGNITDAEAMLLEYAAMLEHVGDFQGAVAINHRSNKLRDQIMTTARQKAMLELTSKFDDERKTREIDLLKRDNALKSANLRAQQLRQALTVMIAVVVVLIAGALAWAFTRVRRANGKLRHASEHDTLTGVRNRRYFNDKVLARHVDRSFNGSVVLLDLDHFKRINDFFGHPGGDAVLQAIAKRLQDSLRENDTLVRWGGEEFLVVLPAMSREQLTTTVRRLLAVVQDKPVLWRSQVIPVTISIGYAAFPVSPGTMDVSLDRAIALVDKALYEAKKLGRNRACMITEIRMGTSGDLSSINAAFDVATADNVVQLRELESVRA
jgi:diguanylate cyclase (GGDEF)-like protein